MVLSFIKKINKISDEEKIINQIVEKCLHLRLCCSKSSKTTISSC